VNVVRILVSVGVRSLDCISDSGSEIAGMTSDGAILNLNVVPFPRHDGTYLDAALGRTAIHIPVATSQTRAVHTQYPFKPARLLA
jgi:hypothetical protein